VGTQTKEDDDLCEKFCVSELYELEPIEQARIFELLVERVEASEPVKSSMKTNDTEAKALKQTVLSKKEKVGVENDFLIIEFFSCKRWRRNWRSFHP
jgi:hypothetical protein